MRLRRIGVLAATAALLVPLATACGKFGSGSSGSDNVTLAYWASNQGTSLDNDKQVLQPELDKFKAQTGITVNDPVTGEPRRLAELARRRALLESAVCAEMP